MNMKIKVLFSTCIFALFACQMNTENEEGTIDSLSYLGMDLDEYGCKTSAGYTWSKLQEQCVRPWENKIQLNVLDSIGTYQSAAYVTIDSTKKAAEIFLKEQANSIVLPQERANEYRNENYLLKQIEHCWTLIYKSKPIYQEKP